MSREDRDQALFDRIATRYARKDVVMSSALARRNQLLAALQPVLSQTASLGTIVEIGCGIGAPAKYLAGHYENYIGVDQSEELIKTAVSFNHNIPHTHFIAANIKTADIPPKTADLILSDGALHHMSDLEAVMACLHQIAKPGAWLVAREPQNGNPLIQFLRWARGRLDGDYSTEQTFFSEAAIRNLYQRHGLTQLQIEFQGFFIPPFAQVILNPQAISVPLSRLAHWSDTQLHRYLPRFLKKLSFNIVAIGRFV